MKRIVLGWVLALCTALAWALPSTQEVQQAVQRGDYAQAETMMREVIAARPGSANAHYVYAEILAHNGKFTLASDEAKRASEIDPDTKFTDPAKFRAFQQLLEREQHPQQARTPVTRGADAAPATPAAPAVAPMRSQTPGIPGWIWVVGLAVVGYGAWKLMSRNSARSNAAGPAYNAPMAAGGPGYGGNAVVPGNPYGPGAGGGFAPGGYGPGMQAPGAGGGMLRTGAAVAGGLAAGMLVDQMLNRGHEGGSSFAGGAGAGEGAAAGAGAGAFESLQPDTASAELENRPIDFGNGDGWDAGSTDVGSGDSSDDGGWS